MTLKQDFTNAQSRAMYRALKQLELFAPILDAIADDGLMQREFYEFQIAMDTAKATIAAIDKAPVVNTEKYKISEFLGWIIIEEVNPNPFKGHLYPSVEAAQKAIERHESESAS